MIALDYEKAPVDVRFSFEEARAMASSLRASLPAPRDTPVTSVALLEALAVVLETAVARRS
jgi:hypothetical protein